MDGGVSKAQTRQPYLEKLVDIFAGMPSASPCQGRLFFSSGTGNPESPGDQPPRSKDLAQDEPEQSTKRPLNITKIDLLPAAKRYRLTRTDAKQPRVEDEPEQEAKV